MKKGIKFFISIIVICLAVLIVCILVCKNNNPNYKDILELDYDEDYANNNADIKEYFQSFNYGEIISMYEYADKPSLQDTLMLYYFLDDISIEKFNDIEKIIVEQLISHELSEEELENSISEIVDVLYLLSCCNKKYNTMNTPKTKKLEDFILKINTFIDSTGNESTELFIYKWKLINFAKSIGMDEKCFADWREYGAKISDNKEETNVLEIINILFENNKDKAQRLYERYIMLYQNGEIDIETYIIYIGLLSEVDSPRIDAIADKAVYEYCMKNFYSISPMLRFLGFKVLIEKEEYKESIVIKYAKMPTNKDGMVSTICIILPTYRRLYSYIQVCKVVGIELKKEAIGNWIGQINVEQIRIEDLFYAWLIFQEYPEFMIELDAELKKLSSSAARVKIGPTNSFNVYFLLKVLACEDVNAETLYNNYMKYLNDNIDNINSLEYLWKMELEFLYEKKEPNVDMIYGNIKLLTEELRIDYYYYALNLLFISGNNINVEDANYILSEISTYRTHGGYYANGDFEYVDIYRTYQCVFIENKIERNNV